MLAGSGGIEVESVGVDMNRYAPLRIMCTVSARRLVGFALHAVDILVIDICAGWCPTLEHVRSCHQTKIR